MTLAEQYEQETGFGSAMYLNLNLPPIPTPEYVQWLENKLAQKPEVSEERKAFIRKEANTVFELTKGFMPEQRSAEGNAFRIMEEMAGYVLELTNQ